MWSSQAAHVAAPYRDLAPAPEAALRDAGVLVESGQVVPQLVRVDSLRSLRRAPLRRLPSNGRTPPAL